MFHSAPVARRGRVGSYQLSVFGFQIVTVFGRIRIVHLAHYSVGSNSNRIFGTGLLLMSVANNNPQQATASARDRNLLQ